MPAAVLPRNWVTSGRNTTLLLWMIEFRLRPTRRGSCFACSRNAFMHSPKKRSLFRNSTEPMPSVAGSQTAPLCPSLAKTAIQKSPTLLPPPPQSPPPKSPPRRSLRRQSLHRRRPRLSSARKQKGDKPHRFWTNLLFRSVVDCGLAFPTLLRPSSGSDARDHCNRLISASLTASLR